MTDRTPIPPVRHSKELIKAIEKARADHPGAQQTVEAGKWFIRDGEAVLAGPSATQWDAWMEVSHGSRRSE